MFTLTFIEAQRYRAVGSSTLAAVDTPPASARTKLAGLAGEQLHPVLRFTAKMGLDFVSVDARVFRNRGSDVCNRHLASRSASACVAEGFS